MAFLEEYYFLGDTLYQWSLAIGSCLLIFLLLVFLKKILTQHFIVKELQMRNAFENFMAGVLIRTRIWFILGLSMYMSLLFLSIKGETRDIFKTAIITVVLLQIGFWGTGLINFWVNHRIRQELERNNNNATNLGGLGLIARIGFWSLLFLLILDNIPGIEVSTLVASLGVTGVAVALAVQSILGDLFASLSITLDKPFVIGDFINVGEMTGSVEHIGLKSTRVRSLSGEQLIFSNSDLLNSRIRNYKRMERRRVAFTISVSYDTSWEKLAFLPEMLREVICQHEKVTFDRAHFKALGDSALNFEVVYFVDSPDYLIYMDTQQAINLELFRQFNEKQIEFAFPTQTVFVHQTEVKAFPG